jgi:branched-chain amino acid transport system substrate-binding protein
MLMRWERGLFPMLLFVGTGCGESRPARIGALYTHDNPMAAVMVSAAAQTDSASGRPLTSIAFDETGRGRIESVDAAVASSEEFARQKDIVAVVGPAGSSGAIVAASVLNHRGIPHVVPNATSHRLAAAGEWTFRLSPDDKAQGRVLAAFALDTLHARRIAILHVNDDYGEGIRDGVSAALEARGERLIDEIVIPSISYACRASDGAVDLMARALIARSNPDLVVWAGSSAASCAIRRLFENKPDLRILASDVLEPSRNETIRALAPEIRRRIYSIVMGAPVQNAAYQAYLDESREQPMPELSPSQALTYDAFAVVAAAVRAVGANRDAVRRWLESLGRSRPAWTGITGPISFVPGARDGILRVRQAE